jgi:hypothetical protein
MTMNKQLSWLIAGTFIVKCILAMFTELNNDEVYYWTYAQHLQWNYFDHPPMIALLLRLFTFNLSFQHEFFLRLGPMICAIISTHLVYLIGKRLKDEMTGTIAAMLFIASPYDNVIAGLLVIPDAPMLMFWLWSVWLMLRISGSHNSRKIKQRLLLLGVAIGCCISSKVHGIFLWAGFLTYIVLCQRSLLRNPFLYYALFITAIFIIPVFYWNLSNHFISYTYHSSRVSFFSTVHWDGLLRETGGEIIYNNPVSVTLMVMMLLSLAKGPSFVPILKRRLLLLVALPLTGTVIFLSIFKDTLPHWSGPAYATLLPLTAAWIRSKQQNITGYSIPSPVKWALGITIVLLLMAVPAVKWWPWRMGNSQWQELGSSDVTLDMNGWRKFGTQFDSLYNSDLKTANIRNNPVLVADYWFPAAHLDYYVARPAGIRFMAIGGLTAIHHYAWLNVTRPTIQKDDDAYFVTVSNFYNPPSPQLTSQFEYVLPPVTITQYRIGTAVRNYFIYRLKRYKGTLPLSGVTN